MCLGPVDGEGILLLRAHEREQVLALPGYRLAALVDLGPEGHGALLQVLHLVGRELQLLEQEPVPAHLLPKG
jgi:hypothetical protein